MLKDDNIDHKMIPVSGYEEVMNEFRKEVEAEGGAPAVRGAGRVAAPVLAHPPSYPPPHTHPHSCGAS